MDQCTHEVRAAYWKGIIKACGERPAGQSAKSWMDENGICEQSYYHWQRKFRKQAYDLIKESAAVPAVPEKADIAFVEVPYIQPVAANTEGSISSVAVIQTSSVKIEITNDISDPVLTRILREVSHA